MKNLSGTYFSENGNLVFIKKNPKGSFKEYYYESSVGVFQVFDFTVEEFVTSGCVIKLDKFIPDNNWYD